MNIIFLRPQFLLLLFIIPLLIAIHFITLKSRKREAILFANFEAISRIRGIDFYSKNIFILVLSSLIIFFIVLGISGLTIQRELYSSSFSFVIAIDNSHSMSANDLLPTRLDAAKTISTAFVNSANAGTKIGVVSFSGNAIIQQELTDDKNIADARINDIELSGIAGTDVAGALNAAIRIFNDEPNKAVILLSDGQINVGEINDSLESAIKKDVMVHTIAIGTKEGGQTIYGLSKVDEDTLKALSFNTGGKFFRAANTNELENDFADIAVNKLKDVNMPLSNYLFFAAVIVFVLEFILINTRYRTIP